MESNPTKRRKGKHTQTGLNTTISSPTDGKPGRPTKEQKKRQAELEPFALYEQVAVESTNFLFREMKNPALDKKTRIDIAKHLNRFAVDAFRERIKATALELQISAQKHIEEHNGMSEEDKQDIIAFFEKKAETIKRDGNRFVRGIDKKASAKMSNVIDVEDDDDKT